LSLVNILQNKYKPEQYRITETMAESLSRIKSTYSCVIKIETPGFTHYEGISLEGSK